MAGQGRQGTGGGEAVEFVAAQAGAGGEIGEVAEGRRAAGGVDAPSRLGCQALDAMQAEAHGIVFEHGLPGALRHVHTAHFDAVAACVLHQL